MIRTFRRLFESTVATAARAEEADAREHGYHVATAALLVEVMRADYDVRPEERDAVLRALEAAFGDLSPDETRDLLARAEERADDATSLYEFTQHVNRQLDHDQKAHVVELLWRVAYADGRSRQVRGAPGAPDRGPHPRPALGVHPDEAQGRARRLTAGRRPRPSRIAKPRARTGARFGERCVRKTAWGSRPTLTRS